MLRVPRSSADPSVGNAAILSTTEMSTTGDVTTVLSLDLDVEA